jgi:nucleotide-binding universal stress UspA family protein
MTMRVLVAADASPEATAAAQWLAALPLPDDATGLVLTAVQLPASALDIPTVAEFKQALLDEGAATARAGAALLAPRFSALETRVVSGDPRAEIVRVAREWAADLVVVAARGLGAVATAVLGSVSLAVVRHAPCAVLVVRPDARPLRSAAVAVDGSAGALDAARFFARLAPPPDVRVRIVGVVEPPRLPASATTSSALRAAVALIIDERRRELEEAVEQAGKRFANPARELPKGGAAETLERISGEVNLMVLGARGLGAWARLLLGSVSERVLRNAACPVLIVRHPDAR